MNLELWFPLLGLALWLGAMSVHDLRTRQVPNWLTLPPLVAVWAWQLAQGRWQALVPILPLYLLWRLNVIGGADAKVLMALFGLWPTLDFLLFFCLGYLVIMLPVILWRHRQGLGSVGRRMLATLRGGFPSQEELEMHGLPAIPVYAVVAVAYAALQGAI